MMSLSDVITLGTLRWARIKVINGEAREAYYSCLSPLIVDR